MSKRDHEVVMRTQLIGASAARKVDESLNAPELGSARVYRPCIKWATSVIFS